MKITLLFSLKKKVKMPSWTIHEKWCQALGIRENVCREVNRIVDSPPHDIEDNLLKWAWAREAFESGKLTEAFCFTPGDVYEKLTTELAEIRNRFGEEGIKATFSHIALDRIAGLIELGFSKEEIWEKLIKDRLTDYIPDNDEVFDDISREVKPSSAKIQRRKEFEELASSGVYGMFMVDGVLLPPIPALVRIKSKLKKGQVIYVKWGSNVYAARRGQIGKALCKLEDLGELIEEISKVNRRP